MKKLISYNVAAKHFAVFMTVLVLAGLISGCGKTKEIEKSQTIQRVGLTYDINASVPFTGKVIDRYTNEQIKAETSYKNGSKTGLYLFYDELGAVQIEARYKDDKPHGKTTVYYPDGQISGIGHYKAGKAHGIFIEYDEKGNVLRKMRFKNDVFVR